MARRLIEQDVRSDRSKVRVFFAEAEGSNQSIQEMLRALVATMDRPASPTNVQHKQLKAPLTSNEGVAEEASNDAVQPNEAFASTEIDPDQSLAPARRKRGDGPKTDRNAGIEPIADLDFVPDGKPKLKVFFSEKAPASDLEQVLVLGYYLQHMLNLTTFGPGHILAAFKHVGKPIPVDLRQTIRNMKKSKVWVNFTNLDAIRVTTEGDNVVEHELPRSS